jgi:serine/threonine-protein kinase ULK/ATG1
MTSAIDHLQNNHIIHRDIKPSNILIHGQNYKLTDFGLSRVLHNYENQLMNTWWGTPAYMSPQIL